MYIDPKVVSFIDEHFIPVRIHVREQPELWKTVGERFGVQWTPTILVVDPGGKNATELKGFFPQRTFLAQLTIGLAKSAFGNGRFADAEKQFQAVVEKYPNSEAAPEAMYWAGVSRYKASNNSWCACRHRTRVPRTLPTEQLG